MISNEYLAGFIDGEGTISIKTHKDKRIKRGFTLDASLTITNCNVKALQIIQKRIGGTIHTSKNTSQFSKEVSRLYVRKLPEIRDAMAKIFPYLLIKGEQADLMGRFCSLRLKHTKNDGYSKEEMEIAKKITRLNERGIKVAGILG